MRQHLNAKKVRRLAEQTGLDVVYVLVRGGTDHRRDLCLRDRTIARLYPDGTITIEGDKHVVQPEEWLR